MGRKDKDDEAIELARQMGDAAKKGDAETLADLAKGVKRVNGQYVYDDE